MSAITVKNSIVVHDWAWPIYQQGVRDLRVILRKGGCTSRLTRKGAVLTLTATGPAFAVAPVMASFLGIGERAAAMHKKADGQSTDVLSRLMGPRWSSFSRRGRR